MQVDPSTFNDITGEIISGAIEVHRALGPGLVESVYKECMHYELAERRLRFEIQRHIPIAYKTLKVDAQILTYLALSGCPVGLLINFQCGEVG